MKKMVQKSASFIDILKAAESSCDGSDSRIIMNDDDYENDGDRTVKWVLFVISKFSWSKYQQSCRSLQ